MRHIHYSWSTLRECNGGDWRNGNMSSKSRERLQDTDFHLATINKTHFLQPCFDEKSQAEQGVGGRKTSSSGRRWGRKSSRAWFQVEVISRYIIGSIFTLECVNSHCRWMNSDSQAPGCCSLIFKKRTAVYFLLFLYLFWALFPQKLKEVAALHTLLRSSWGQSWGRAHI